MKYTTNRILSLLLCFTLSCTLLSIFSSIQVSAAAYSWPVPLDVRDYITNGYTGPNYSNNHTGADFACPIGTPIYAVASGTVITAVDRGCLGSHRPGGSPQCSNGSACGAWNNSGNYGSYGNYIYIQHTDGVITRYCHLSTGRFAVSSGQTVQQGQLIGYSGCAGNATGPHLHFEFLVNGTPNNPANYLSKVNPDPNPNPFPGEEDTSWNVPVWKTANYQANTYDSYGSQESNRWIDAGDNCYIEKVYQNGYAWVKYPSSASSDGYRWAFTQANVFSLEKKGNGFPGAEDTSWKVPVWKTANSQLNTYDSNGNQESNRWIDAGDNCYIEKVYQNGYAWVKYPSSASSDGYRWAYTRADGFSLEKNNWHSGISPVTVGSDFYAYIINTAAWKHLTNDTDNVSMRTETGNAEQVWKFDRQGDGSYKITNAKDGKVLDDNGAGTSDGANVQVYSSNDSAAQRWFIYGESGAYFLRAACGDLVLDITGGSTSDGTNVQMWSKNDSAAQKFQIWKLNKPGVTHVNCSVGTSFTPTVFSWNATSDTTEYDVKIWKGTLWEGDAYKILWSEKGTSVSVDLPEGYYEAYVDTRNKYSITMSENVVKFTVSHGTPVFLGQSFTANIINAKGNLCIGATSEGNVNLQTKNGDDSQKWLFEQQEDYSYRITNLKYNKCMDVYNNETANNTNIQLWQQNGTDAQYYYVRMNTYGYSLIPKCNLNGAVDIKGNTLEDGTNIQEWTYHGENAQTFSIEYLSLEPTETQEYNGHRYEYYDLVTTWNQAYRVCEQKGGHLVTVESKAENDFVQVLAANYESNCWMGSTDFADEGNWCWITGERFDYTNWYDGEPNNEGGKEHYMAMYTSSGQWNDFTVFGDSHKNTGFICEYGTSRNISASDFSPSKTFEYNGIKYEVYTDSVDLPTAQQICKLKKGRLAIVENETENNAIVEAIADSEVGMFWINATDIYSKGSWTSFSKDTLPFTCWDNNEPNNTNNVETYAVIKKNGKWNDLYGFYGDIGSVGFICKYDKVTPGDINSDGKVNMKDLVLLQQYLNNWDVTIDERAANVNGDNKINMKDLVLLQQFLNNWDVELV